MIQKTKRRFLDVFLDETIVRTLCILVLLFKNIFFFSRVASPAFVVVLIWAFLLIGYNIFTGKYNMIKNHLWLLAVFLAWALIPCFLFITRRFSKNMESICVLVALFFFFFPMIQTCSAEKLKAEMVKIFRMVIIFTTILSIFGILFSLVFVYVEAPSYTLSMGMINDSGVLRYTGFYTNPNLSAFCSSVAMMMCHCLLIYRKRNGIHCISNMLIFLCFVSNFLTLILSDSNASLILILLYFFVYYFCQLLLRARGQKLIGFFVLLVFISLSVALVTAVILVRTYCQSVFTSTIHALHPNVFDQHLSSSVSKDSVSSAVSIGRSGKQYEITNGRLDSLKKGLKLFLKFPIFGVGKYNIFMFSKKYLKHGLLFFDVHNGYLSLLLSTGIVGFALFMTFLVLNLLKIAKTLFSYPLIGENKIITSLFSMLIAYCVFTFAERCLLFDSTFMVFFFWLILGYTVGYVGSDLCGKHSKSAERHTKIKQKKKEQKKGRHYA